MSGPNHGFEGADMDTLSTSHIPTSPKLFPYCTSALSLLCWCLQGYSVTFLICAYSELTFHYLFDFQLEFLLFQIIILLPIPLLKNPCPGCGPSTNISQKENLNICKLTKRQRVKLSHDIGSHQDCSSPVFVRYYFSES
jgi:hypothetical protein